MNKFIIVRGISGSGKSTWARSQAGAIVVSRDDIRVMLYGSDGPDYYEHPELKSREAFVTKVERAIITNGLNYGKTVISDNTNIEMKFVNKLAAIGYSVGVPVEVKVFDVAFDTAVARVGKRAGMGGRDLPVEVIRKQYDRFVNTKNAELSKPFDVQPYEGTPGKPKAFLVDIDGTLAHMRDYREPFEWHKVHLDDVDDVIADITLYLSAGSWYATDGEDELTTIVMSGRDEVCRKETEEWLDKHNIHFDHLFMRPEGDSRKDNIVKAELFDNYVRDNYDVKFVLDDRDQVVDMWRSMGLTCLQVAPGDF